MVLEITAVSVLVSLSITLAVTSLLGTTSFSSLFLSIAIPAFIAPLFEYRTLKLTLRLEEANALITDLLSEKELILTEVHHRIKNNLSTMKALLSLQADVVPDPRAAAALEDAARRIQSMAVLYDKLYQSPGITELSLNDYLSPLIDEILANFPGGESVVVHKEIDKIVLDAHRLQSIGIIVNELLTNSMKHAFELGVSNRIGVSAVVADRRLTLEVEDNGRGLPPSDAGSAPGGFGMSLVDALAKQLGARVAIEGVGGTRVTLSFPVDV